jgi:hypothetical protein
VAGRKVYRTKNGKRKQNTAKAFHAILIILLLAVLVYLGYILAGPLFRFLNQSTEITPQGWTPPVVSDSFTAPSVTKLQDNTDTQTGGTVLEPVENKALTGYAIPVSALSSKETLAGFAADAQNSGFTAVVVPLKLKGGEVTYLTQAEMAISANIVTGTMTAKEIADTITEAGLTPICTINLLEDNTSFTGYRGVYKFASDNSRWYDNNPANGGKSWISPFDNDAKEYLKTISSEVSSAGFKNVIFDGLVFPPFRNSDLGYIGSIVSSPDRYKALIAIWESVSAAVTDNGATPMLMIPAETAAADTAEILHPNLLEDTLTVIKYDASAFPTTIVINGNETILAEMTAPERVRFILGLCRGKTSGMTIIPYITGSTPEEVSEAVDTAVEMGYSSYIV